MAVKRHRHPEPERSSSNTRFARSKLFLAVFASTLLAAAPVQPAGSRKPLEASVPRALVSRGPDPLDATLWATECTDRTKRQLQFMKGTLTYIVEVYSDEACEESLATLLRIGSYELRDVDASGAPPTQGSWPLDLTMRSISLTPHSSRFTEAINAIGECGIRDWKAGSARSLLGVADVCYYLEAAGPWAGAPQLAPSGGDVLLEWVELSSGGLRVSEGFGTRVHRDARTRELLPATFTRE